jgi:hypothetical protein
MGNLEVKLNTEGVRQLLKSEEMKDICAEQASSILGRVGSGYTMDTYTGQNRVNAMVRASTPRAMYDNLHNNTLLKAVKG